MKFFVVLALFVAGCATAPEPAPSLPRVPVPEAPVEVPPPARAENTAIAMAQSAASQVASAVRPGGNGPLSILTQAADSTDRIAALIAQATRGDGGN